MKEKNKKPLIFISLIAFVAIVIGGTLAFYSTSDTYNNEFDAASYIIEAQEQFVSPEDWVPGDTTQKTVVVTNKGTVDVAVKVCLRPSWKDANNQDLPLKAQSIVNGSVVQDYVSKLNLAATASKRWKEDCNSNLPDGTSCYYYYKKLEPNESTSALLDSVTFNPNVLHSNTNNCVTDSNTNITTCSSPISDYAGGTYTLNIDISTVQFDQYENAFSNVTVKSSSGNSCENLSIRTDSPQTYRVAYYLNDNIFIKDDELSQYDLTDSTCEVIYIDDIVSDENKYNRCFQVVKIDEHTYEEGETVELTNFPVRYNFGTSHYENGDWVYTYSSNGWEDMRVNAYFYEQNTITNHGYTFNQTDNTDMNFSNIFGDYWSDSGRIGIEPSSTFTMPNHDVLFTISIPRD